MIHHKLTYNRFIKSTLTRKSHNKSSIKVIVANCKAWSTYHCILDHIAYLLIFTYLILIGSKATTSSRSATSQLKLWVDRVSLNLLVILSYIYFQLFYTIFHFHCELAGFLNFKGMIILRICTLIFKSPWMILRNFW